MHDLHGWRHLSVGDLGRLGRRGKFPRDVSLRLMVSIANSKPGAALSDEIASLLLSQIDSWRREAPVIADGFPSAPSHIDKLPAMSGIVHLQCDLALREPRLMLRGEKTARKWTPGLPSERDQRLDDLLIKGRTTPRFMEVDNNGSVEMLAQRARTLAQWAKSFD